MVDTTLIPDTTCSVRGTERDGIPVVTVDGALDDIVLDRVLPLVEMAVRVRGTVVVDLPTGAAGSAVVGELLGRIAGLPERPRTMVSAGRDGEPWTARATDEPLVVVRLVP